MDFTPWALVIDLGIIGLLLTVSTVLRARIKFIQELMIPAPVIAGFLGLALGPAGANWLPFSNAIGSYGSVLIAAVFACIALGTDLSLNKLGRPLGQFLSYTLLLYSAQVVVGILLTLLLLGPLFDTPEAFGVVLFSGWAGGFGTAAAVGDVFTQAGHEEVQSLAYTSATVGLLIGILGGVIIAKYGAKKGYVEEFAGLKELPEEIRTGILPQEAKRPSIGTHVFSSSSIDTLGFHLGVIAAITAIGYMAQQYLKGFFPSVSIPVFSLAFILGLIVRLSIDKLKLGHFVDRTTMQSISGTATDVLIVFGIASIKPGLVADYWVQLTILFAVGLVLLLVLGLVLAPRVLDQGWFEKQIFTWGWATGALAQGIALLRIVDPKLKSRTLEDYALLSIFNQNEILAVTFIPALVVAGASWTVAGIWGLVTAVAIVVLFILARGGHNAHSRMKR